MKLTSKTEMDISKMQNRVEDIGQWLSDFLIPWTFLVLRSGSSIADCSVTDMDLPFAACLQFLIFFIVNDGWACIIH